MKLQRFILAVAFLFSILGASADEGMWLPILLKKHNMEQIQQKGFKLSAEDIYDINHSSLKDAVVGLVRLSNPFHHFCTGELVSGQGLFITNHHCGYGVIQEHSSVEHDYLTDGFWAMSKEQELPGNGIGVCFLKRMEDVTERVLEGIEITESGKKRDSLIRTRIAAIEKEAVEGTTFAAKVKPFFSENEYYLSVYEIFRDIRLVGAPPSAIGKFGGDTDNWMWPRHTGDFTMFRIYANADNHPADFALENKPYKPERFLKISLDGVNKGDFTMVMGYPGTTQEFLPSFAVKHIMEVKNPIAIKIRTEALNIMNAAMNSDRKVRIQYSAKAAGMANGWKKWIGENRGLQRLNAISVKQNQEKEFAKWVESTPESKNIYGNILSDYEKVYAKFSPIDRASTYYKETAASSEILSFSLEFAELLAFDKKSKAEDVAKKIEGLKSRVEAFYKDYHPATDQKLFEALMNFYFQEMDKEFHPAMFDDIAKKYQGNISAFAQIFYQKSMFDNQDLVMAFLNTYKPGKNKALLNDPAIKLANEFLLVYKEKIRPGFLPLYSKLAELNRLYVSGIRKAESEKVFFPDANSTFRIAYGKVDNYIPRDAVEYKHQTTIDGMMEKDNPDIYDYRVPEKLKELYFKKNFGQYANHDGKMPVCFTASNHTTGGNSGSPIVNADGNLIGVNFDRNWEGTMSDIMYDPEMCRNIALDIRYVLFIVDKYAGAGYLLNEMELVKSAKASVDDSTEQHYRDIQE